MNAKQSMLRGITPAQIRMIHSLVGALGFDDALYRDILQTRFNVGTSKELANFQAGRLIEELQERALQSGIWKKSALKQRYDALSGRPGYATVPQLALIENLWAALTRMETPELKAKALRAFVFKVAKVSDLRFLDSKGAGKVIVALRRMELRRESKLKEEDYGTHV